MADPWPPATDVLGSGEGWRGPPRRRGTANKRARLPHPVCTHRVCHRRRGRDGASGGGGPRPPPPPPPRRPCARQRGRRQAALPARQTPLPPAATIHASPAHAVRAKGTAHGSSGGRGGGGHRCRRHPCRRAPAEGGARATTAKAAGRREGGGAPHAPLQPRSPPRLPASTTVAGGECAIWCREQRHDGGGSSGNVRDDRRLTYRQPPRVAGSVWREGTPSRDRQSSGTGDGHGLSGGRGTGTGKGADIAISRSCGHGGVNTVAANSRASRPHRTALFRSRRAPLLATRADVGRYLSSSHALPAATHQQRQSQPHLAVALCQRDQRASPARVFCPIRRRHQQQASSP